MKPLLHHSTESQIEGVVQVVSGGYIFHGPKSIGKATTAFEVARRLNCLGDDGGECAVCHRLRAGTYPDYIVVRPEEKPSITIEQIRTLVQTLSLSPYQATSSRVVVVDQADALTVEAQNALLKLIEEPPTATRFILVAVQPESLLPTVRSRLGSIYFAPIARAALAAWLESNHRLTPAQAAKLAAAAEGIPGTAVALLSEQAVADERNDLDELATTTMAMGRFERLQTARHLIDTKADLWLVASRLQYRLIERLTSGAAASGARAVGQLAALELFRRQLAANVSPRVALERLMLEL